MELTAEEIKNGFNTGDRKKDAEMINSFLSGQVSIRSESDLDPSQELTDVGQDVTVEETPDQSIDTQDSETSVPDEGEPDTVNEYNEQLEQQRAYAELLEQRRQEEHEEHLRKLKEREDELKREKDAREELETRLRQLEELREQRPTSPDNIPAEDEEDEYASEYVKRTRRMVEELKATVGATDPVVKELREKIESISSEYEAEREARRKHEKEKAEREAAERQYNTVRDFQKKFPELQTQKDIQEVEDEYFAFRKKVVDVTGVRNAADLDKKIEDYRRGGETKALLEKYGVKPPDGYDQYLNILDLIEMKRGYKYDPVLGKNVPILDDEGQPVRYRSLEEAYRIKNFEAEVTRKKQEAYKDIQKKLSEVQQSAVELPPDATEGFSTGLTAEQEREYLYMDPREWSRDPEKKRLVEMVYRKRGLDVPKFRGR